MVMEANKEVDLFITSLLALKLFPFRGPQAKIQEEPRVHAIAQAAKELVEQRDRWLNAEGLSEVEKKKRSLTNLYNARPTWLDLAHKRLDEAVFAAYGWKSDLSDEEILEKLLALNLERSQFKDISGLPRKGNSGFRHRNHCCRYSLPLATNAEGDLCLTLLPG